MSDLGTRLKHSIQTQELDFKFMELLNANRNLQSIKEREILPAIPLSAFHVQSQLPQIHNHKAQSVFPKRSLSETKLKPTSSQANVGAIVGVGTKALKDSQRIMFVGHSNTANSSAKNLIKIRNRSVESAHRQKPIKSQSKSRLRVSRDEEQVKKNPLLGLSSQKNAIQITPQKVRIELGSSSHTTTAKQSKQQKVLSNKTIQQMSGEAIDNLMFNIKFGKIQQNISYKSYLRKETQPPALQIIKKLEEWLTKHKIKSGLLYTRNLHSIFARKSIPNSMILAEFSNYSHLKNQMQPTMPGLQYYPEGDPEKGRHLAATKIQSLFRMNFQMKYTKKLKSLMNKVKMIQRQWRVSLAYRRARQLLIDRVNMKIERVKLLTNGLIKNWQFIKTSPRVQVHICSIALEQFKRLSLPDLQFRQISQLTRIFKAAQPDSTIVYVSPFNFSPEIIRYYERVFEFGKKGDSFRNRLFFISVQYALTKISPYLTTVAALVYDHAALSKIKEIIKDRQTPVMGHVCAYIVPSYPSNQFTNLAAELDIPIFSGPQSQCKLYSTKSGHYELFRPMVETLAEKCPFQFPKTVHGIYSEKELLTVLAVLIHKNKHVKKWMFKIDDEVNSRGLAVLNVDGLAFLKQLRRQEDSQENIEDKEIIGLIVDELKAKLRLRLKIIHKSVYPDYNTYISHFYTRGGILQACIEPETRQGTTSRPCEHSISFKIDPNGQFQILTTYSRLELGYRSISSTIQCPSELLPHQFDNEKVVRALYRHLWTKHKLFGYFVADFLYLQSPKESKQNIHNEAAKRYLIGFDCFLNEKTNSILVPSLTSLCQYSKQSNRFLVRPTPSLDAKSSLESLPLNLESERSETEVLEETNAMKTNQKEVYFFYCPFLKFANLPQIPEFFKMCKFNNVSFDVQSKTGTLFLLQGGLENGCLGFVCIGDTSEKAKQQTLKLVEFLSKQFGEAGKKKQKAGYNEKQMPDELGQLRGILLNSLRRNKAVASSLRREDISLQMIF